MHIVALGGGGFSMEPDNPLLDQFILSLSRRPSPRVCFVPTAGGEVAGVRRADRDCGFGLRPCCGFFGEGGHGERSAPDSMT